MEERVIVIGERGEYGRRLVDYLERHLPDSTRLLLFTEEEKLAAWEGEAQWYLLGEDFFRHPDREGPGTAGIRPDQLIELCNRKEEGKFCRTDLPGDLLAMLGQGHKDMEADRRPVRVSLLYSPVFLEDLTGEASTYLEEGGLYLGAEDLGPAGEIQSDMGDLCYYIHVREESIMDRLKVLVREEEGRYYLDSPDLFFYLRQVTPEDYAWFFDRLRADGSYPEVIIGAGSGFLQDPELLKLFDRLILLDCRDHARHHLFCERLIRIIRKDYYSSGLELVHSYIGTNIYKNI